jgi:RNA polymerase sigma-70 factor (ECF subfamily)
MSGFSDIRLPETVAQGVLRGDRSAFADAYRLLAQPVMNLAARMLKDRQLAEEVVQDAFIDLVEKSSQIRDSDSIVPWIRRVAVNHCLMKLRSPWHARRTDTDAEEALNRSRTDQSMTWVENVPAIEQALMTLGDEARAVVLLHDVEGYTHKEIGALMGKTPSFSKSQLARAYEKLLMWQEKVAEKIAEKIEDEIEDKIKDEKDGQIRLGHSRSTCTS